MTPPTPSPLESLAPAGATLIIETPATRTRAAQRWELTLAWMTWDPNTREVYGLSAIGTGSAIKGGEAALYTGIPFQVDGDPERIPGWDPAWNHWRFTTPANTHWRPYRQRVQVDDDGHTALHLVLISADVLPSALSTSDDVPHHLWAVHWGSEETRETAEWLALQNQPVPLDANWQSVLIPRIVASAFTQAPRIDRLAAWQYPGTPAPRLSYLTGLDRVEPMVKEALRNGLITVPEGPGPNPAVIPTAADGANAYLTAWAPALGQKLERIVRPRVQAGGPMPAEYDRLLRKPLPAQADVIQAVSATLAEDSWVALLGEQGVGKTLQMSAAPWDLFVRRRGRKGYRVLVQAPDHLLNKWAREIKDTVPDAETLVIRDWQMALHCRNLRHTTPHQPEYYIIGRDRGKLSYATAFAGRWNRRLGAYTCPDCGDKLTDEDGNAWGKTVTKRAATRACPHCQSPLWQATPKIRRVSPIDILARYAKDVFNLAIVDEAHELKGATEQGHSLARIRTLVPKLLIGTGSYSTGYADDLAGIQWRTDPGSMVADDLPHDEPMKVLERYGRLEKIIPSGGVDDDKDGLQGRRARGRGIRTKRLPGISPLWYATKLVSNAVVISMEDVGKQVLPPYQEEIAWVTMDEDQAEYHAKTMDQVSDAARAALQSGSRRLLGAMLTTGLTLPDEPWRSIRIHDEDGFPLVDTIPPDSLTADRAYPKEARALQEIKASLAQGRRVWAFANYTDSHDQLQRLADLLTREGISNRILRANVDRQKREAWVDQATQDGVQVCLSHPQLVETGLDFLAFPTILWLSTGYNLMRLRQASRRAWRIGQTQPCRVIFLAYQNTLQEKALVLMGRKMEAAFALEGQLSLEGLQSLAADDNGNELARALVDGLEGVTTDVHKIWAAAPPPDLAQLIPTPVEVPLPATAAMAEPKPERDAEPVLAPTATPSPLVVLAERIRIRHIAPTQLGWDWDAVAE